MPTNKDELILEFNKENQQLLVTRKINDGKVDLELVNCFKFKEAVDIYELLTGGR